MSNVPVFVGLDYHQDSIQVCVLNQKGDVLLNRSAANDSQELGRIVQPLGIVQRVGIEACCGAADLGQELVERLGWNVSLGHPAYIAKIKSSPDKSDFSDGRLLADLTRVGYLPRVWLARPRRGPPADHDAARHATTSGQGVDRALSPALGDRDRQR
ncbi:MAG: IS110 family transposase [Tepidisphaeraceae bacterium]